MGLLCKTGQEQIQAEGTHLTYCTQTESIVKEKNHYVLGSVGKFLGMIGVDLAHVSSMEHRY